MARQPLRAANIDATCARLAGESGADDVDVARADADPVVISSWMAEVQGERLAAERELAEAEPQPPLSAKEIKLLVRGLRSVARALANAEAARQDRAVRRAWSVTRLPPGQACSRCSGTPDRV